MTPDSLTLGLRERLLEVPYGVFFLFNKLIVPWPLSPLYPTLKEAIPGLNAVFWIPGILVLLVTLLSLRFFQRQRELLFGLLFFWISLIPIAGMLYLGHSPFDHYLYLPMLGIILVLVYGAIKLYCWTRSNGRHLVACALLMFSFFYCLGLVLLTAQRVKVWRSDLSLWKQAVVYYPGQISCFKYGIALAKQNDTVEAIKAWQHSLAFQGHADTHFNLGMSWEKIGQSRRALSSYSQAITLRPGFIDAMLNRGNLLFRLHEYSAALADFNRILVQNSSQASGHFGRGAVLSALNRGREGDQDYRSALAGNSQMVEAWVGLSLNASKRGEFSVALNYLDQALQLRPNEGELYFQRGLILLKVPDESGAVNAFERALAFQGDHLPVLKELLNMAQRHQQPQRVAELQQRIAKLSVK